MNKIKPKNWQSGFKYIIKKNAMQWTHQFFHNECTTKFCFPSGKKMWSKFTWCSSQWSGEVSQTPPPSSQTAPWRPRAGLTSQRRRTSLTAPMGDTTSTHKLNVSSFTAQYPVLRTAAPTAQSALHFTWQTCWINNQLNFTGKHPATLQ